MQLVSEIENIQAWKTVITKKHWMSSMTLFPMPADPAIEPTTWLIQKMANLPLLTLNTPPIKPRAMI
jgi:hypothetical protein